MASHRRKSDIIPAAAKAVEKNLNRRTSACAEYDSYPPDFDDEGGCSEDHVPPSMATLATKLTSQPWHQVGAGLPPVGASSEFDVIVEQLSSLLAARLRDLLVHRVTSSRGDGGSSGGGDSNSDSDSAGAPPCEDSGAHLQRDHATGQYILAEELSRSVREYVACIGRRYDAVSFHSFEHAAHVTVSANKLLSMITGSNKTDILRAEIKKALSDRHMLDRHNHVADLDFSFGIRRDPRIMFAMVFSALIHDVGHKGVPNSVLVEEEDELAILHNDVSVAEQNSLQVAFSLLQRDEFTLLKKCICPNPEERKFFRKKVISMVMVTDISDQERTQIVASRWDAAFPSKSKEDKAEGQGGEGVAGRGGHEKRTSKPSLERVGEEKNTGSSASKEKGQDTPNENLAKGRTTVCSGVPPLGLGRRASRKIQIQSQELKASLTRRRFSMFATGNAAEEFANERRSYRRLGIRTSMDFSGNLLDAYRTNDQLQQHAVLDTIMNVADVAHTMQAFPVFCKWNKRLFKEFYVARLAGRLSFDPEANWYEGQIGFLSHYIIPLSQKVKTCGVFGTTGYVFEYFAVENKKRWIKEGEIISENIIRESKEEVEREQRLQNGHIH